MFPNRFSTHLCWTGVCTIGLPQSKMKWKCFNVQQLKAKEQKINGHLMYSTWSPHLPYPYEMSRDKSTLHLHFSTMTFSLPSLASVTPSPLNLTFLCRNTTAMKLFLSREYFTKTNLCEKLVMMNSAMHKARECWWFFRCHNLFRKGSLHVVCVFLLLSSWVKRLWEEKKCA